MLHKAIAAIIFLLPVIPSFAQEKYDTLIKFDSYAPSYEKDKDLSISGKEIRKYNQKGQLVSLVVYKRDLGFLIRSYMITNTYGANDSIKTSTYKWIPKGFIDWKTTEIRESIYRDNLLREIRITDSAYDQASRRWKKEDAVKLKPFFPTVSVTDTSGWTSNKIIRFEYDGQNRVIKKSFYLDINYDKPATIWTYTYDEKDLPEVNTNIEVFSVIRSGYHYLYKNGLLHKYREDIYSGPTIMIKTEEYDYTPDGKIAKILTSHEEMLLVKEGKKVFYKTKAKERLYHKQFYEYSGGLLSSLREESLIATTVNKRTFWDGLAATRMSSSTIRYGDMETRTTTTTFQQPGTTEKTKYSWEKETTQYQYNSAGKLVAQKTGGAVTEYIYDVKGRLREVTTTFPDAPILISKPKEYTPPTKTIEKILYVYNK
jgi:hypothetical protein